MIWHGFVRQSKQALSALLCFTVSASYYYPSARYDEIAPPHSYINAMDFANPKALAEFILQVDSNPAEYLSYFWWKKYYSVRQDAMMHFIPWCELCRMLNDPDEPVKVFNDYYDLVKCSQPPWDKEDWFNEPGNQLATKF